MNPERAVSAFQVFAATHSRAKGEKGPDVLRLSHFTQEQLVAGLVMAYEKKHVPTSLVVVSHFGKRDADVLRAVDSLITEAGKDFAERNFVDHDFLFPKDSTSEPHHELTRTEPFSTASSGKQPGPQ